MHDHVDAVLRDAFDAAWIQLREQMRKMRGEVKKHPDQEVGAFVDRLFPEQGYGFLKTIDGRELYFHRNSVLHNRFDHLAVGTGVRYVMEEGEKGPQASTVEIEDKPGARKAGALGELPSAEE